MMSPRMFTLVTVLLILAVLIIVGMWAWDEVVRLRDSAATIFDGVLPENP